ncbi:hypothetical protein TWF281_006866 [Arthrobotrys megalospora]
MSAAALTSKAVTASSSIFAALNGTWTLRRTLSSALPSFPSGTFTGSATFTPHDSSPSSLLYSETGELKTENGLTLRANKKYIYRYDEVDDKISAWFVKESRGGSGDNNDNSGNAISGVEPDYLFHELVFGQDVSVQDIKTADGKWTAAGDHLCIKDNYSARYEFTLKDGELTGWSLRYNVKGPAKDYISETRFQR